VRDILWEGYYKRENITLRFILKGDFRKIAISTIINTNPKGKKEKKCYL
jgi:hypothetical protein